MDVRFEPLTPQPARIEPRQDRRQDRDRQGRSFEEALGGGGSATPETGSGQAAEAASPAPALAEAAQADRVDLSVARPAPEAPPAKGWLARLKALLEPLPRAAEAPPPGTGTATGEEGRERDRGSDGMGLKVDVLA